MSKSCRLRKPKRKEMKLARDREYVAGEQAQLTEQSPTSRDEVRKKKKEDRHLQNMLRRKKNLRGEMKTRKEA